MDLIKIGKYIAEKRKALGLTQKQLAEKLNMSDKSVSKWERGVSQNRNTGNCGISGSMRRVSRVRLLCRMAQCRVTAQQRAGS